MGACRPQRRLTVRGRRPCMQRACKRARPPCPPPLHAQAAGVAMVVDRWYPACAHVPLPMSVRKLSLACG